MSNNPVTHKMDEALRRSSAFREMDPLQAQKLRSDLLQVMDVITEDRPRAVAMDDKGPIAVGGLIKGTEQDEAAKAMAAMKKGIDFGDFVKRVVTDVYTAIVKSTSDQITAYQTLLDQVLKPVQDFANETITDAQANTFALGHFPNMLSMGGDGKLGLSGSQMPDLGKMGMPGMSLDPNNAGSQITDAAKLALAKQRQQMLATLVLMGINRIVVTDGEIRAAMSITLNTDERAATGQQSASASQQGIGGGLATGSNGSSRGIGLGSEILSAVLKDVTANASLLKASTAQSIDQNSSDAYLNATSSLTGSVLLKFRSDAMPMDRFADTLSQSMLSTKATPPPAPTAASSAASPPAADPSASAAPAAEGQSYGGRGGRPWFRGSRGTPGAPWPVAVPYGGRSPATRAWGH